MSKIWDYKWTVLLLTYMDSFSWRLSNSIIAPLLPLIIKEFNLSYLKAGLITTSMAIVYCFLQYPIGILADKFGRKNIMVFGLLWSAVICALIPYAPGYYELLVLLAVLGVGNGMHFIPGAALLSDYFSVEMRGRALSIQSSSGSVSMLVAPLISIPVAGALGWRAMYHICASVMIITVVLFWIMVKEPQTSIKVMEYKDENRVLRSPVLKLALAAHLMGYTIPVVSFIPTFLINKFNMDLYDAGLFYMIIPLTTLVLSISTISGRAVDRLRGKTGIMLSTIITTATTFTLTAAFNDISLILVLAFNGLNMAVVHPTILSYASNITRPKYRATEMGFINTLWVFSGVIAPSLIGAVVDAASFEAAFIIIATIAASSLIIEATIKETSDIVKKALKS